MTSDPRLLSAVRRHPYPPLFTTISGAHLYGFPSPDSDHDVRGVHILPAREVLGLHATHDTIQRESLDDGLELDLVTHDIKKFFGLLLKKNGYVLEQLYSPLVVHTTPEHEELKQIARGCITRHHAHHYLGFADTQWKLFDKERPRRVKPLLYIYRVLLTGINLMRTGEVQANLVTLNESFRLPYVPELVARKVRGAEDATLTDADVEFHRAEDDRLVRLLQDECACSALPDGPSATAALSDLLVRVRMSTLA
jgi:predicted nucleotidyltransferase